jgi:Delta24(24(1))-sterol reductase
MSQKSRFKMQGQGVFTYRKTFPQLPYGTIKNPEFIQTKHGLVSIFSSSESGSDLSVSNKLLTSGWWRYCRKPNYTADFTMSFLWGAIVGTASPIPYFYPVFFITVLVHRCGRDFERYVACAKTKSTPLLTYHCRCAVKYGDDWKRYCEVVPYKFIPFIY